MVTLPRYLPITASSFFLCVYILSLSLYIIYDRNNITMYFLNKIWSYKILSPRWPFWRGLTVIKVSVKENEVSTEKKF